MRAAVVFIGFYYIVINIKDGFESGSNNVPHLKPSNDECVVALFYTNWCPHCTSFKPIFDQLKSMDNKICSKNDKLKGKKLRFEKVNCEEHESLGKEYKINGYPTVKIITKEGVTDYTGSRDLDSMQKYFS